MTRYTPLWEAAGSYAASVDRRLIAALWPTAVVSGCAVTVSAGTMNMNIAAGSVVVPTPNNTGSVLCYSDAIEVVSSPTAPASGSNRIDVIVCLARGNDLDGGSNNDFVFQVVAGTAAASPTVPATPAGAVAIAQVLVIGGAASLSAANLTDLRPYGGGGLAVPGPRTLFYNALAAPAGQWTVQLPSVHPYNTLDLILSAATTAATELQVRVLVNNDSSAVYYNRLWYSTNLAAPATFGESAVAYGLRLGTIGSARRATWRATMPDIKTTSNITMTYQGGGYTSGNTELESGFCMYGGAGPVTSLVVQNPGGSFAAGSSLQVLGI